MRDPWWRRGSRVRSGAGSVVLLLMCVSVAPAWSDTPVRTSCAALPPVSTHPFAGTVESTSRNGRVAEVRTDDGRGVEVRGTDAVDSPGAIGATSVDRTFVAGTRYEFHPLNSTSPFSDNACTATRPLAPLRMAAENPAGSDPSESPERFLGPLAVGGLVLMIGSAAVAAVAIRRMRSSRISRL